MRLATLRRAVGPGKAQQRFAVSALPAALGSRQMRQRPASSAGCPSSREAALSWTTEHAATVGPRAGDYRHPAATRTSAVGERGPSGREGAHDVADPGQSLSTAMVTPEAPSAGHEEPDVVPHVAAERRVPEISLHREGQRASASTNPSSQGAGTTVNQSKAYRRKRHTAPIARPTHVRTARRRCQSR